MRESFRRSHQGTSAACSQIRITQVLGWTLDVSVPYHPAAPSPSSYKEAGKMGFVGHFALERLGAMISLPVL
jgi:hypothetical protein